MYPFLRKWEILYFCNTLKPVDLPKLLIQVDNRIADAVLDTGAQKSFLSSEIVQKYFYYKTPQKMDISVLEAANKAYNVIGTLKLKAEVRPVKIECIFLIMEGMGCHWILGIDFEIFTGTKVNFLYESITFVNLD